MIERDEFEIPDTLPALGEDDAAALDALIESGLDRTAASESFPALTERIARAAGLLGMLGQAAPHDPALVDVTLARVLRSGQPGGLGGEPELTPLDEEALESWIMHGYEAERVAGSLRPRARRHEALAALVTAGGQVQSVVLIDRTMTRVQAEIERQDSALDIAAVRRRSRSTGFKLSDLVSVAAVVLIGSAVLLPVMNSMREQQRQQMCKANLGTTASGMASYASSNRDALPMAHASLGGGRWWDVGNGSDHSNSANLYTLTKSGYVPLASLACPGNPSAPTATSSPEARDWRRLEEVSYSYQIMFGPQRPNWGGGQAVVLADRSPVVLRAIRNEMIDPMANAPNHQGAGQHMLKSDGSVQWASSPVLPNGDNIWLPRAVELRIQRMSGRSHSELLKGNELPGGAGDSFLGP